MTKLNIIDASFTQEMMKVTANMYRLGWDERNGGNISYLLTEEEVAAYLDIEKVVRTIPMQFDGKELAGKYFIVTGSGKYFKNVIDDPAVNLGVIRVAADGKNLELLWGLEDGGRPTSELPSPLYEPYCPDESRSGKSNRHAYSCDSLVGNDIYPSFRRKSINTDIMANVYGMSCCLS